MKTKKVFQDIAAALFCFAIGALTMLVLSSMILIHFDTKPPISVDAAFTITFLSAFYVSIFLYFKLRKLLLCDKDIEFLLTLFVLCIALLGNIILMGFLYFETLGKVLKTQTIFLSSSLDVVGTIPPEETDLWKSDPLLKNTTSFSYKARLAEFNFAGPIFQTGVSGNGDPELQILGYSIEVEELGTVEKFLTYINNVDPEGGTERWLKDRIKEFNKTKRRELAGFNDSLNQDQQYAFYDLLMDFLRPRLQTVGMTLKKAEFHFCDPGCQSK